MSKVSLTALNNNLLVSNATIEDLSVNQINVTDDIYVNYSVYTPVGAILSYAGQSAPGGWLLCDGSEVSKSLYPRLFSVIGTIYGTAVNINNFVLPNLVDRVPVGKSGSSSLGDSSGNSSIILSVGQLPSHTHTGTSDVSGSHSHTGTTDISGEHTHSITDTGHSHSVDDAYFSENHGLGQNYFGTSSGTDNDNDLYTRNINTGSSSTNISINSSGNHTHTFTTGNAGSHAHTFTTNATGSGSSIDIRNKYVVLNYIIRY